MQQNRELQAEITFRTDSSESIAEKVRFNHEIMIPKKLPSVGLQYRIVKNAVDFDSIYTFEYTEKNGPKTMIPLTMNPFLRPQIEKNKISKKFGGILNWRGDPLNRDDGLILIFTDAKGQTFSINHSGISRGNKFEIVREYANRLAKGTASLLITRKKTTIRQKKKQSLLICIEYYHKAIEFEVID